MSDEIYRGAELDGKETPTIWGRYERAIVTSGLSKAFALPGLRVGWVVAPPELVEQLWGVHDYTTIAPGAISDRLARIALSPSRRELLLARTRGILRTNYPTVKRWIERRPALSHVAARGGCDRVRPIRAPDRIDGADRANSRRAERAAGARRSFEMDGYIRIGFGCDPELLLPALERVGEVLDTIDARPRTAHAR